MLFRRPCLSHDRRGTFVRQAECPSGVPGSPRDIRGEGCFTFRWLPLAGRNCVVHQGSGTCCCQTLFSAQQIKSYNELLPYVIALVRLLHTDHEMKAKITPKTRESLVIYCSSLREVHGLHLISPPFMLLFRFLQIEVSGCFNMAKMTNRAKQKVSCAYVDIPYTS